MAPVVTSSRLAALDTDFADSPPVPTRVLDEDRPVVYLSSKFLFWSATITIFFGFTVGTAARNFLVYNASTKQAASHSPPSGTAPVPRPSLPQPIPRRGKKVPQTIYSSKDFKKPHVDTSNTVHMKIVDCEDGTCPASSAPTPLDEDEEDSLHLPAGQHLLFDVKNVSPSFLDSERRLAKAMVDSVDQADLTLLSYHCHSLSPKGVSCVGVLLESHISFHTWPDEGVITLDLFTCGAKPLLPAVQVLQEQFGVPAAPELRWEEPVSMWSHFLRGFRPTEEIEKNALAGDLGFLLSSLTLDLKDELVSVQTKFQRIDVYNVINPRFNSIAAYQRSKSNDGSYESLHPEFFTPDRIVFLDGVLQSTSNGDSQYHEALVHPAMLAGSSPKKVAIIGGGEGATLREVLKYKSVEKVSMIEIDELMVSTSREYLPEWSDCSDIQGSADSCFEDVRADVVFQDAMKWFTDRFSPECNCEGGVEHRNFCLCGDDYYSANPREGHNVIKGEFDVVIMDALDPSDTVAADTIASKLYSSTRYLEALFDSLTEDGVLVMQLGESVTFDNPPEDFTYRNQIINAMERYGFHSFHIYDEDHCGFSWPWSFLVACKSESCRTKMYRTEAQVNIELHSVMRKTKSGAPPLKNFDGATMAHYQVPSKAWEINFCHGKGAPECAEKLGFGVGDDAAMADVEIPMGLDLSTPSAFVMKDVSSVVGKITKKRKSALEPYVGKYNPVVARRISSKYLLA